MPTTWLSVLLFAVVVAPGILYDQQSAKRVVKEEQSAFREIGRIALASLAFSSFGSVLAILAHRVWPDTFLNLDQALRGGSSYVTDHNGNAAASLVLVVGAALGTSWLVGSSLNALLGGGLRSVSGWTTVLSPSHPNKLQPGTTVFVSAYLSDGSAVQGRRRDYSADLQRSDRELVIASQIWTKKTRDSVWKKRDDLDAVVVSGADVVRLEVEYSQFGAANIPRKERLERWARDHVPMLLSTVFAVVTAVLTAEIAGFTWGAVVAVAVGAAVGLLLRRSISRPTPSP
ncbi:DUF6338 family protein [Rhodococcus sp. 1168]|uniref:DUF6338 family protein n=1 Tax=Rhodococcus sp. 1168 TaxID=2018041 RepID=UPI000A0E52AE|nr:DUF6338 family protein [Rhodococcus sp. 1168]ORI13530.1 hypothetical protein BJI47_23185 [Rhodococcus sp. 1168]